MALQEPQTPTAYSPIYNDFIFLVALDPASNVFPPNFKYVADVYINQQFVRRLKAFPNQFGAGIFRLDRIAQDYVTYDIDPTKQNLGQFDEQNCESIRNIFLVYSEEYGDLSTGTTIYTGTSFTGVTKQYFNGALSYFGDVRQNRINENFGLLNRGNDQYWRDFQPRNYIADIISNTTFGGKFLTNSPRTIKLDYSDYYYLRIIQDTPFYVAEMVVNTYDFNDNLISGYTYVGQQNIPNPTGTSMCNDILSIGIGPLNINSLQSQLASQPNINQNVKYYEVYTQFNDGVSPVERTSEIFTVYLKQQKYYDKFTISWLNNLGAFDRYTFEGRNSQTKSKSETREYQRLLGNADNISYNYDIYDTNSREIIYQKVDNTYSVFSQFITKDESYWLNECYTSPVTFLTLGDLMPQIQNTIDLGGLTRIKFKERHNYELGDLLCIFDCNDPSNNVYCSIADIYSDTEIYTDAPFFSTNNGFTVRIGDQEKQIGIIINDKNYLIKQGISPRNIQVNINFTLANDDPKQNGGRNKRTDPYQ
jgi:hypothetical protein